MEDTILSIDGLRKEFGEITAVDDVSFDVDDGEFVTILGPSGSGKSTILRMIAGFENPTSGSIGIRGDDVVGVPPFERDVNMVFQHLAIFPHLTVEGNIEYGLKNSDVPEEERKRRVDESLEMVHLEGYNDRDPTDLSGGEQQRVALARALVNEPAVVLFDEPLASLDRQLRQHMQMELQRIQNETGTTFVYVTHDQEIALSVADRLILLNHGQIEQVGSAQDLYEEPETQFVAEFIGDINSFDVTVNTSNQTLQFSEDGLEFELDTANFEQLTGDVSTACVRPHEIDIRTSANGAACSVPGKVTNRIYQGETIQYQLDTDFGELSITTDDESFAIGDEVYAEWDPSDMHLFAGEPEEA